MFRGEPKTMKNVYHGIKKYYRGRECRRTGSRSRRGETQGVDIDELEPGSRYRRAETQGVDVDELESRE